MQFPSAVWIISSYVWAEAFVQNPPKRWSQEYEKTVWHEILQMFWHRAVQLLLPHPTVFLELFGSSHMGTPLFCPFRRVTSGSVLAQPFPVGSSLEALLLAVVSVIVLEHTSASVLVPLPSGPSLQRSVQELMFLLRASCLWLNDLQLSFSVVWRCCLGEWHVLSQSCLDVVLLTSVLCRWSPLLLFLSNTCLSVSSFQEVRSLFVSRRS